MAESPELIAQTYSILGQIGDGAYGKICAGLNVITGAKVAIKFEKRASLKSKRLQLEYESYKLLKDAQGFPKIYYFGKVGYRNVLVMDALGPSLQDLLTICDQKMSVKTVLMLAEQMIRHLQTMHQKGLLHRDIKPENFIMGRGHSFHKVYMIDMGMTERFYDERTQKHVPQLFNVSVCGTINFTSINVHTHSTQSRRDDMESLAYVLIFLLEGRLPWTNIKGKDSKERHNLIQEKKLSTSIKGFCKNLPSEFAKYLSYCRSLAFNAEPDYENIIKRFRRLFVAKGYDYDYCYDWLDKICQQPPETDEVPSGSMDAAKKLLMQEVIERCTALSEITFDFKEYKEMVKRGEFREKKEDSSTTADSCGQN